MTLQRALLALGLAVFIASCSQAEVRDLKPIHERTGTVEDLELQKLAPRAGYITNAKDFETIWKEWKIGDNMPEINFDKEIVLVSVTRGSRITLKPALDDKGDLKALAISTRDLRPGFRFIVVVVPLEGVKTINGKGPGNE